MNGRELAAVGATRKVVATAKQHTASGTKGLVVHWAGRYDLLIWLLTFGRERRFRERLLGPARLQRGESVLDVGCGTGTLAIAANRRVGVGGSVHGVDASPEMIARARSKAKKAGAEVVFENALAESLPFPDARFDVVLSTVMLHHLPGALRREAVREMRRVLKPGGRLLAVDFGGARGHGPGPLAHFHRHGHVDPRQLIDLATDVGLRVVESGPLGMWDLQFVLAEAPRA
jgi:ubiquinone/menaquinone biosynthesis C-methylase UbiE